MEVFNMIYICITLIDMFLVFQSANIGPQVVLKTPPSSVPRTSAKDLI